MDLIIHFFTFYLNFYEIIDTLLYVLYIQIFYSYIILVCSKIFVNIMFKSNKLNSKYMKHDKINDIVNPKNSQETSFTNLIIDI